MKSVVLAEMRRLSKIEATLTHDLNDFDSPQSSLLKNPCIFAFFFDNFKLKFPIFLNFLDFVNQIRVF